MSTNDAAHAHVTGPEGATAQTRPLVPATDQSTDATVPTASLPAPQPSALGEGSWL
ncbi:hypothetical protein AB0I27_17265 [Streptomyces sp. NPDC050597]|uniref:hypothetical protein n=1 Tax=Streptomyces sp. NPDC050597 TaxID=3157212 RepID=UPI003431A512